MDEVRLSVMSRGPQTADVLGVLLELFESQFQTHVQLNILPWEAAWPEIIRMALYLRGPDVSEIGNTWVSNLIAMNALRPFPSEEMEQIGAPDQFLPQAWKTCYLPGNPNAWSIPWLSEAMILHYRRDLLRQANINEQQAFTSFSQFTTTLRRLRENGNLLPIGLPTRRDLDLQLHILASFIWQRGGAFVSEDGKQILFNQPEAMEGIHDFFQCYQFLPQEGIDMLEQQGIFNAFHYGQAACMIAGPWLLPRTFEPNPVIKANWGVTLLPGIPFIGGSNLVIWRQSHKERLALELIKYLTSPTVLSDYAHHIAMYPARLPDPQQPVFLSKDIDRAVYASFIIGRSFPVVPLWGMIEERLTSAIAEVWNRIQGSQNLGLRVIIQQVFDRAANHLNVTLRKS